MIVRRENSSWLLSGTGPAGRLLPPTTADLPFRRLANGFILAPVLENFPAHPSNHARTLILSGLGRLLGAAWQSKMKSKIKKLPALRLCLASAWLLSGLFSTSAALPVITNPPTAQTIFIGDPVTFRVGASGTAPLGYQWFRNGAAVSGATVTSLAFTTTAPDHLAQFTVAVTNLSGAVTSAPVALAIDFGIAGPSQTTRLLEVTDLWRYHVNKTDLGTAWTAFGYNDSAWASGGGLLYVESAALPAPKTTALPATPNPLPSTCYFRARFTNSLPDAYSISLIANTVIDDGLVLHLNGAEALRLGMPAGAIAYGTWASRSIGDAAWEGPLNLPAAGLLPGTNVLAAEVHQINAGSSDIVMGLTLDAVWQPRLRDTVAPVVANVLPAPGSTVISLGQIEVQFSEAVQGVDATDLRLNGIAATNFTLVGPDDYVFHFAPPATGLVSVTWAPGHGITDRSVNANAFTGAGFSYFLDPLGFATRVRITEFLAANESGLRDEDGEASDWIELFNSGAEAVNLAGWSLTDDDTKLTKWKFPAVTLLPQSYLLVWASSKNRTNVAAPLHTNFKLEKGGEYLALIFSDGVTVASAFAPTYPAQQDDIAYGRDRLDPSLVGYFTMPTPRAANSSFGVGFGPEVQFSLVSRPFMAAFNLTLTQPDTNFVIRYFLVTNGASAALTNVPSASSPLYTGPLLVSATTQVRTRTFPRPSGPVPDIWFPGPPRSETFVLMVAPAYNFSSDVPLVLVHNFGAGSIPATVDQAAVVMVFGTNWGRATFANPPDLTTRAGINRRGSSTQDMSKPSLAVEAWDEFNTDRSVAVLGMPAESDWVLYAPNVFDSALIHNPLAYALSRAADRYASRTRFAELFLNTAGWPVAYAPPAGGHYGGLYVIEEKIKRSSDRVDIAKLEPEHTTAPEVTGGYLLKIDRADANERTFNTAYGQNIVYQDPKGPEIQLAQRSAQANYIQSYFNSFETALYGANATNPVTGYAAWIDRDSWIDHHIINVLGFNVDALRLSGYFFKDRGQKLEMGPVWDFDRGLGCSGGDMRSWNPRVWRVQAGGDQGTDMFGNPNLSGIRWWQSLFRDPDFWQRWIDRWQELRRGPYATTNLSALVDTLANQVREAQTREFYRWTDTRPRGGTVSAYGYSYNFPGSYQGEVNFLKQWLSDRGNFFDTNCLRAPVFSGSGGAITSGFTFAITAATAEPNSVIYYTLNGTDPRLPGGGISPMATARTNSTVLTLTANARVFARNRNPLHANLTNAPGSIGGNPQISSPWSGPTVATFYTATPPLRLTEIMYHPSPPPAGNTNDANNFEYLEFLNVSASSLNLAGFRLSGGVDFTFPSLSLAAGQRVLLVKNLAAFQSRYGTGLLVAGVFTNQLANDGDHLVLEGPLREPIHDFTYRDDWYPITDGAGFALAIRDANLPLADWGIPASWRPSGTAGGTPGAADAALPAFAPIVVNEVLTHTDPPEVDSVELYNPTATNVNVGGWFLSDDRSAPKKYRIPNGVVCPAGRCLTFTTNQFGAGPNGFALSALGDQVFLCSGDAQTNLTGYLHGFSFGVAPNGVSLGRYLDSLGREHFPLQAAVTLGATNSAPRVGPVVISEIMYHPPDASEALNEFVELANLAVTNAPLFDPAAPTNTCHLRGAVDFDFPPGVVLAPGERVLVVGFPPTETNRLVAFRSRYLVPADVRVFGPWSGQLNNAGESLKLKSPDVPNLLGAIVEVPYWTAEEVTYATTTPWPAAADGLGFSLQRATLGTFADDPANWFASGFTPGRPNAANQPPLVTLTAPTSDATVYSSPWIEVTAAASDPDGAVQRVEFWDGAARLLTLTNSPYLFTWQYANPGPHLLCAVAVDNAGVTSTSAPVALTVLAGTDTDRDGLPDDWELANGTNPNLPDADLDLDGDGHSSAQEFITGTSPTNAASVLRLAATLNPAGQLRLSFEAISNRTYSLLGTPALGQAWTVLTSLPAAPTNRVLWFTIPPAGPRCFRVVTPSAP